MLRVIEIDFHTSGAFVNRFESSELGLLLETGLRNYYYIRVILRDAVGVLHLTRAVGGLQGL